MSRAISFPVPVTIRSAASYHRIATLAEAEGFETVSAYVQFVVDRLATVTEPLDLVLRLHLEGRTVLQICEETGLTRQQVRTRIHRAGHTVNREGTIRP